VTYSSVMAISALLCLWFVWSSARQAFPVGALLFAALAFGCGFLAGVL
jgi:hypothetical protein